MRVLIPGHQYSFQTIDDPNYGHGELITFVSRVGSRYPGNTVAYPGTTSQEVLRALIDRAKYVNRQIPCWQTRLSVWLMRLVIWLYEHRAKRIKGQKLRCRLRSIEDYLPCRSCGHILCQGHQ